MASQGSPLKVTGERWSCAASQLRVLDAPAASHLFHAVGNRAANQGVQLHGSTLAHEVNSEGCELGTTLWRPARIEEGSEHWHDRSAECRSLYGAMSLFIIVPSSDSRKRRGSHCGIFSWQEGRNGFRRFGPPARIFFQALKDCLFQRRLNFRNTTPTVESALDWLGDRRPAHRQRVPFLRSHELTFRDGESPHAVVVPRLGAWLHSVG